MIFDTEITSGTQKQIAWAADLRAKADRSKWAAAFELLAETDEATGQRVRECLVRASADSDFWIATKVNRGEMEPDRVVSAIFTALTTPKDLGFFADLPHRPWFKRAVA